MDGPGEEAKLIDLFRRQHVFREIVEPSLKGVEFEDGIPARWWPQGRQAGIVLDPERSFGKPIEADTSVPADVLAAAAVAEGSPEAAARVWVVPVRAVKRAIAFMGSQGDRTAA
jgi:hypothetical protein